MKFINCNLCGSDEYKLLFKGRDRMISVDAEYNVVECQKCGLIFLNPQPEEEELSPHYSSEYEPYIQNFFLKFITNIIAKIDARIFKRYLLSNAKVLEIGCSSGEYLSALRDETGWEVTGIDISDYALSFAQKMYNLKVIKGNLIDIKFESAQFDLVIMRHVYEHLNNPDEILKEIKRILKPKGICFIVIPNADTIERSIFKEHWWGYDVPRHLFCFSVNTIKKLLEKNGFKILVLKHSMVPNNWIMSIKYYFKIKNYPSIFFKFFSISNPLLLSIFTPISLLESFLKTSGRIKILAQK
jgi:2-polyprenyl-3-methyl-5-hydroxy-6-metoxy-1,4-benzoquinol methylase